MKFFKPAIAAVAVGMMTLIALGACASKTATPTEAADPQPNQKMKSAIVYFTHSGNTELAARKVAVVTGGKVVRLLPEQPYSAADVDWVNEQSRCTREHLDQSLRPAIKPVDIDFSEIDTLFIGFPIWWHEEPAVIRTFLDDYGRDLKGKVLYPFCTSYESPMSEADSTLRKGYPALDWKNGLRLPAKPEEIKKWIKQ